MTFPVSRSRTPERPRHRARRALGLGTALATAGWLAVVTPAAPASAAPLANFQAASAAGLLDVEAVGVPGLTVGKVQVSQTLGVTGTSVTPRSAAGARNINGSLLGAIPLDILASASQTAPPDNPSGATSDVVPAFDTPILGLGVSNVTAGARWGDDETCLAPGVPLTTSMIRPAVLMPALEYRNFVPGSNESGSFV